jgi:hypothetical protein
MTTLLDALAGNSGSVHATPEPRLVVRGSSIRRAVQQVVPHAS